MKISQISVFLENTAGRVAEVTRVLKEGGVNLRALMIADTADFGILRIIADDSEHALKVIRAGGFMVSTTDVLAVSISDKVGALADVLAMFDKNHINIEYVYASLQHEKDSAVIIFRVEDIEGGLKVIEQSKQNGDGIFLVK